MMVIGRAKDLGSCQAMTAKGKLCGDWCDAYVAADSVALSGTKADFLSLPSQSRVNRHCAYHVQGAIRGTKASRPETANT
jgi:hypothetical protein